MNPVYTSSCNTQDLLGIRPGGRYCVVPEEDILRSLVQSCWHIQAHTGAQPWAMDQAAQALERWVRLGLPCCVESGRRLFDNYQVSNFALWASQTSGDPAYAQGTVENCRREVGELNPVRTPVPGTCHHVPFRLQLRREFNLRGIASQCVVRLRVPLPLEGHRCLVAEVRVVEPVCAIEQPILRPGRLEIKLNGADLPEYLAIEVDLHFTACAETWVVDPRRLQEWDRTAPEYQLYTRLSEGLIQVTGSVVRLADGLAGSCTNAWLAVRAFWRFFFEQMRAGSIHHDELDEADPLGSLVQHGWFDCYSGSALMAALCRARGIPARIISGFTLYRYRPSLHYWLEVLLPPYGWVPLDLYSWTLAGGKLEQAPWDTFFLGHIDHRLTTECLPRLTLGPPGVRFPRSWYVVQCFTGNGNEMAYHSLPTGELLYRDRIRVDYHNRPAAALP